MNVLARMILIALLLLIVRGRATPRAFELRTCLHGHANEATRLSMYDRQCVAYSSRSSLRLSIAALFGSEKICATYLNELTRDRILLQ